MVELVSQLDRAYMANSILFNYISTSIETSDEISLTSRRYRIVC